MESLGRSNLKLELTEYFRQLYNGGDDDDDGSDGDGVGGSESTLSHQLRKRRFRWSYRQTNSIA